MFHFSLSSHFVAPSLVKQSPVIGKIKSFLAGGMEQGGQKNPKSTREITERKKLRKANF